MKHFSLLMKSAVALVAVVFLFSSCGTDETVNPVDNVSLSFKGISGTTSSTARVAAMDSFMITEAKIGVKEIELKQDLEDTEGEEQEELEYDFEGPYIVDLLAETSTPEIPFSTIEPGIYHELETKIDKVIDNEASILIKGNYIAADGSTTPFVYTFTGEQKFEVENEAGFEISEANLNKVTIIFDFNTWFSGVDFSAAEVSAEGVILLNEENNEELYELIENNLEDAAELHEEDDDHDDDHDDDDDDDDEDDHDDEEEDEHDDD